MAKPCMLLRNVTSNENYKNNKKNVLPLWATFLFI